MSDAAPKWINDGQHDRDIARFVVEGDPFVNRVVSVADAELHRQTEHRHISFASAVESDDPAARRSAVEALYLHLKQDHHLRYEHEWAFDPGTGEQGVRLPALTSKEGIGTCIDLTILFLSCLAKAKLAPVYVQVRGETDHAFAAVWLREPPPNREEFLTPDQLLDEKAMLLVECTGFVRGWPPRQHKRPFEEACAEARALLQGAAAKELVFALDVWQAWENGVSPFEPGGPGTAGFRADISRIDRYAPERLIGRDDELEFLSDAWGKVRRAESPRANVITFVALGGEGKTSLAAKWAASLAADNWPGCDAVYAWSFYSQGTREQSAASSDPFLAAALTFFGDAATANSALHPLEKARKLAELVGRQRALLVLDGLEPLQYPPASPLAGQLKDQGMSALLKGLAARNAGLCVVTTRYSVTDLKNYRQATAPERALLRLSTAAGVELLGMLGVRGLQFEYEGLVEDVKGHALTLSLLGKFLHDAHGGDIRKRDLVRFDEADDEVQGGHAFRVMDAYMAWFQSAGEKGRQAIALLRLLGLFDRPASADCLAALKQAPAIVGLTEALVGMTTAQWNIALTRLEGARLLTVHRDGAGELLFLDAHPLVREYLAHQLRTRHPDAFRAAHRRLFEHLCSSAKDLPQPSLEELQPLYLAVAHGCLADMQPEALEVYHNYVNRRNEFYSTKRLGAFGSDLGAVACFFVQPWKVLSPKLSRDDQVVLLREGAVHLRSVGRLAEACELLRTVLGVTTGTEHKDWKNAAICSDNLSALRLRLGELDEAVEEARRDIVYSDNIPPGAVRHGDSDLRIVSRATLGDALHQAGRGAEALTCFRESEQMYARDQPNDPLLSSARGFYYCDLLLGDAERAAWQQWLRNEAGGFGPEEDGLARLIQICQSVFQRAERTLRVSEEKRLSVFAVALDHLTLGRAALMLGLLEAHGNQGSVSHADFAGARGHVLAAEANLRQAGRQDHVPLGLLTRAWYFRVEAAAHRQLGRHVEAADCARRAQADLDEAWEIADRGPMPLFLADIHLHRARLFHAASAYPWAADATGQRRGPKDDLAAARKLIEKCGYGRRKEELEDAETAARHWRD